MSMAAKKWRENLCEKRYQLITWNGMAKKSASRKYLLGINGVSYRRRHGIGIKRQYRGSVKISEIMQHQPGSHRWHGMAAAWQPSWQIGILSNKRKWYENNQ
jgi:hypothetical protein